MYKVVDKENSKVVSSCKTFNEAQDDACDYTAETGREVDIYINGKLWNKPTFRVRSEPFQK